LISTTRGCTQPRCLASWHSSRWRTSELELAYAAARVQDGPRFLEFLGQKKESEKNLRK
jgi:hypothetical protein